MTEIHAASSQRRDVGNGEAIITKRLFEKQERIDRPLHLLGVWLVLDGIFVSDVPASRTCGDQDRFMLTDAGWRAGRKMHGGLARYRAEHSEIR